MTNSMTHILVHACQEINLATPAYLRHILAPVLSEQLVSRQLTAKIQLCLSEAVTNLVTHTCPKPSSITIRFAQQDGYYYLEILDDSWPWDPTHDDEHQLTTFSEIDSGRGVALMHSQSDKLTYQCDPEKQLNQLQLAWSEPKSQTKQTKQTKQTLLLVEDNTSLRQLYTAYLNDRYHIITAQDGFYALQKLTEHKIDLVLSDIQMPQMNGLTLRKEITQRLSSELIPFIFITSADDDLTQQQASQLGIDDYLVKPVQKQQLVATITRVLQRCTQVYQKLTTRLDQSITASLTPQLPATCHGWRFSLATRNTGSGGGDILLHRDNDTMLQLVLTDIMGHDDSAKFFAHACGGYLHGLLQAIDSEHAPSYLLEQLSNFALQDKLLSKTTLTCCSVQLANKGQVSFAHAGHPPPLHITREAIKVVASAGVLPGLIPDAHYQNTGLTLKKGERVALYTDGLFESANNNLARQQLAQAITKMLHQTLDKTLDESLQQVMALFDGMTDCSPNDDVLLLLMEADVG